MKGPWVGDAISWLPVAPDGWQYGHNPITRRWVGRSPKGNLYPLAIWTRTRLDLLKGWPKP